MLLSTSALFFLTLFLSCSHGAPAPTSKRLVTYRPYNDIQISDGLGGTAYAEAAALFVSPFDGVRLAGVSYADFDAVMLMAESAEDADVELFEPAIASSQDLTVGDALEVGRVKNKILQYTGLLQAMKIKIARRQPDKEDALWEIFYAVQDALDEYVELDAANAGLPSRGLCNPTDS